MTCTSVGVCQFRTRSLVLGIVSMSLHVIRSASRDRLCAPQPCGGLSATELSMCQFPIWLRFPHVCAAADVVFAAAVVVDVQALIAIEASQAYHIGAVSEASRPVDARTSGGAGVSATEGLLFG